MKISCGTDIVEIERIKNACEETKGFIERVFTKKEILYCESKKVQKYQHYAARFAAKEATFKAVSSNLKDKYNINWRDIEILNDEQGKPFINLYSSELKNIEQIDLSLSHCKEYATANVVAIFI